MNSVFLLQKIEEKALVVPGASVNRRESLSCIVVVIQAAVFLVLVHSKGCGMHCRVDCFAEVVEVGTRLRNNELLLMYIKINLVNEGFRDISFEFPDNSIEKSCENCKAVHWFLNSILLRQVSGADANVAAHDKYSKPLSSRRNTQNSQCPLVSSENRDLCLRGAAIDIALNS